MNRRSMLSAMIGSCAALFPWRRDSSGEQIAIHIPKKLGFSAYDDLMRVGRRQLLYVRTAGLTPMAIRLGLREQGLIQEGSWWHPRPIAFSGVRIEWTDNISEITVVTEENTG